MSLLDAARRMAMRYPGGIAAVAVRMGRNYNTLAHELNPNQPQHKFGAESLEELTVITRDPEAAQQLAMTCDHVCIPLVAAGPAGSGEIAARIAQAGKEFGDVMRAVLDAIQDGRVTDRELAEFDRQCMELVSVSAQLRASMVAMVPAKPAHLRTAK